MPRTRTTIVASLLGICLLAAIIGVTWQQHHTHTSWVQANRHTIGDPAAPIHMVEFADFQCPYCASFALTTLNQLQHTLATNGTLFIEYRHYPFLGTQSTNAALAAECAADQQQFWEYHDILYQANINEATFGKDLYDDIAQQLSIDYKDWDACYVSRTHEDMIEADLKYARHLGVTGTPYVFINEVHYRGERDYLSIYDYLNTLSVHPENSGVSTTSNPEPEPE